ncbi:3-oxoacyl-ACP reductase [Acetobacteraceae bacterium KSS8]|uniref:3-oxoacyl-ACP reductase n=1 Tax=Endosaccharibacter trunci TaxID=2812733 RepID=A0ABT1W6W1_9PROT|nr:3-oxoacyl-ACP reductase [Acetobacteraceae bacterium KSS8]
MSSGTPSGDRYLDFVNGPVGGLLAKRLGLPTPVRLVRNGDRAAKARPVLVGAAKGARLLSALAVNFAGQHVVSFYHHDAESWREAAEEHGLMSGRFGERSGRVGALVFDASGIETVDGLGALYRFFHDSIRAVCPNGRILVLSIPPESAGTAEAAAVQRGLEGFTRSLGKEARRAIAVQLIEVAPGAEAAIGSTLRFFLSPGSAYVSGQVVRIDAESGQYASGTTRRTVLVTGAAQGIGAAIAELFSARGDQVVVLDVPAMADKVAETATRLNGVGLPLDITAADAADAVLQHARSCGGFDVVVHNAGITRDRTIARMERAGWDEVMAVNLRAPLRITEKLLAGGGLRPNGRIVCVSSMSGIAGNPGQTNYALTKAALIGLVKRLAPAAREAGATINAVAPGFIETRMTAAIPFMVREAGRRLNAMGQGGRPVDVAEAIAWLADRDSYGVNGQTIRVCGQSLLGA